MTNRHMLKCEFGVGDEMLGLLDTIFGFIDSLGGRSPRAETWDIFRGKLFPIEFIYLVGKPEYRAIEVQSLRVVRKDWVLSNSIKDIQTMLERREGDRAEQVGRQEEVELSA